MARGATRKQLRDYDYRFRRRTLKLAEKGGLQTHLRRGESAIVRDGDWAFCFWTTAGNMSNGETVIRKHVQIISPGGACKDYSNWTWLDEGAPVRDFWDSLRRGVFDVKALKEAV